MPNRWIIFLKVLVHAACLAPVAWLVWNFWRASTTVPDALGADPIAAVTFFTGKGTLRLLVTSLAITPVRRLIPRLSWLIRFRRMLGLYAFFYACLHLLTYVWLYSNFSWSAMVNDITQRRFITAGLTAWVLLVPLALTSTTWSIRKLGKALAGSAPAGVCVGHCRSCALLVGREVGCAHSVDDHPGACRSAAGTSGSDLPFQGFAGKTNKSTGCATLSEDSGL